MKTRLRVTLAALFLLALSPNLRAQGNLVINGDFEAGSQGWTLLRGATIVLAPSHGFAVILASTNGSPAAEPTVSQSLSGLVPGTSYVVAGDYEPDKNRGGASPTNASFGVAFNGVYVFEIAPTPNSPWQHFSFLYTATSSSELLSLTSQINGTGVEYTIDNISVAAVPEPSALVLFGFAALSLVLGCQRKACYPQAL